MAGNIQEKTVMLYCFSLDFSDNNKRELLQLMWKHRAVIKDWRAGKSLGGLFTFVCNRF